MPKPTIPTVKDSVLYKQINSLKAQIVLLKKGESLIDSIKTKLYTVEQKQKELAISKEYFTYTLGAQLTYFSVIIGLIALISWTSFSAYIKKKIDGIKNDYTIDIEIIKGEYSAEIKTIKNQYEKEKELNKNTILRITKNATLSEYRIARAMYFISSNAKAEVAAVAWGLRATSIAASNRDLSDFNFDLIKLSETKAKAAIKKDLSKKTLAEIAKSIDEIGDKAGEENKKIMLNILEILNKLYYSPEPPTKP